MVVCHCNRVNDATVGAAISAGASNVGEVTSACRAGGRCGRCWETIEALLAEARAAASTFVVEPAA